MNAIKGHARVLGYAIGLVIAALAFKIVAPVATPIYLLKSKIALGTVHKLGLLGLLPMVGNQQVVDPPAGKTLISKSREAASLRAKAQDIRKELLDESKTFTVDEVKKRTDEINALEARANIAAEFTASDEVRRQGGAGELERIDTEEGADAGKKRHKRSTMAARIAEAAERVIAEFGDIRSYMRVVVGRDAPQGDAQAKLLQEMKTMTRAIVGTAGDISGGEFVLPLTQVQSIFSLSNVQQGLLQRARAYNVPGRSLRIPYLIQTDEDASTTYNRPMAGMIANVAIVGEGSTKPTREPRFGQRLLNVYKYAAVTQVGDETLQDDFTGELPQEFINAVGQQALNKVNEDITIDGSGTSEPTAALKNGAAWTIEQARDTGGTIKPPDLFGMYAKHTHGPGSVWFASRRTVQALFNMSLTSASLVTFLRDLNGKPEMNILGYPVILTDLLPTLGSEGDLALVNPDFYAFALRQALTVESSRDYAFVQDLTTYRFIVRAGGIPINTGKYAYKYDVSNAVDEHSPFVYLGDAS